MRMITKDEEHSFQYASKKAANLEARLQSQQTHRMHQGVLTTTYRKLEPCLCWAITLAQRKGAK